MKRRRGRVSFLGYFFPIRVMNVLIACEESQRVCIAFREKGHEAFSCDIQPCSGGHPEWHIQNDVIPIMEGSSFCTEDRFYHHGMKWDLIIAHPPCTDLCVSGARHFAKKREYGQQQISINFFMEFVNAPCERIAIENPIGIMSTYYRKPDQIIQPYQFGDPVRKATCLWLKGLPKLEPTAIVEPKIVEYICKNGKKVTFSEYMVRGFEGDRATHRSKTFPGIAKAMAEQWG